MMILMKNWSAQAARVHKISIIIIFETWADIIIPYNAMLLLIGLLVSHYPDGVARLASCRADSLNNKKCEHTQCKTKCNKSAAYHLACRWSWLIENNSWIYLCSTQEGQPLTQWEVRQSTATSLIVGCNLRAAMHKLPHTHEMNDRGLCTSSLDFILYLPYPKYVEVPDNEKLQHNLKHHLLKQTTFLEKCERGPHTWPCKYSVNDLPRRTPLPASCLLWKYV